MASGEPLEPETAREFNSLTPDDQERLAMAFLLGQVPGAKTEPGLLSAFAQRIDSGAALAAVLGVVDVVADLSASVRRFAHQLHVATEAGIRFPCVQSLQGTPTPIDPGALPDFHPQLFREEREEELEPPTFDLTEPWAGVPADEAAYFFQYGLSRFVRARFASLGMAKRHPYSFAGGSPGFIFQVSTNSSGLTVHYTHQYYLNPMYVFGAPTTPVNGYIQAGYWHFGASKKQGRIAWDLNSVYNIPQVFSAHLSM
jgi:hypothetical protein